MQMATRQTLANSTSQAPPAGDVHAQPISAIFGPGCPFKRPFKAIQRRGNFNGTIDQMIVDALIEVQDAEIALSPGFRWGTTLLPGDTITVEHVMDQTAITYGAATLNEINGADIKGDPRRHRR